VSLDDDADSLSCIEIFCSLQQRDSVVNTTTTIIIADGREFRVNVIKALEQIIV
jgi:hypothetical protein